MATKYTLYFSDTANKTPFDLQSYTTNGPESPSDPSPIAGSSGNIETTLKLYGKGNKDYGEPVFQDLIYMLENFSNTVRPVFSIEGQLWYNNRQLVAGSPPIQPELFIRNADTDDTYGGSPFVDNGWDAIILATGASAMTGELILSGTPSNASAAIPKSYVDTHFVDFSLHITPDQNTFLDALSLPTLTALEVDQLIGINTGSTVQSQLNGKLNLTGGALFAAANITFTGGGEVLGLPTVPSVDGAAASKRFVLDQVGGIIVGDGVLTDTAWFNTGVGSPAPDISETTLRLTVTSPGSPPIETTIDAQGISRVGHSHAAANVSIDNSFDINYGANTQTAIEYAASEIELLKTGGVPPSATILVQRIFESLTSDITSPTPWQTQNHFADDSRVTITVNGIKQYAHARGTQTIEFDSAPTGATATGLDPTLAYDFDIAVDGAGANTVTINAGSPSVDISDHAALTVAINDALQSASPTSGATYADEGTFTSNTSGSASTIAITATGSPSNTYLFDTGVQANIIGATFLSNPPGGSPTVPDDITVQGMSISDFPTGMTFTIRNSVDTTYGTYDGVYSVHDSGPTTSGSDVIVPIALLEFSNVSTPLLPSYNPSGSPTPPAPNPGAGSPASYGEIQISPLGRIVQVAPALAGIEGEYAETDISGNIVPSGSATQYVVFNYDILTGSKIESLLYV